MSLTKTDLIKPASEQYLLRLFMEDVASKLAQHALDTIRPKVHEMAAAAAKDMEARLQAALDPMYDRVIVQLAIKETK